LTEEQKRKKSKQDKKYRESEHGKKVVWRNRRQYIESGANALCHARRRSDPKVREKHIKDVRRYAQTKKGKQVQLESNQRARDRHRQKRLARERYNDAVRYGKMTRPIKCTINDKFCSGKIQAHHPNEYESLEVIGTCTNHHKVLDALKSLDEKPPLFYSPPTPSDIS
jgi:hypothetical protein